MGQEIAGGVMGKYSGASVIHTVEFPRIHSLYGLSESSQVKSMSF